VTTHDGVLVGKVPYSSVIVRLGRPTSPIGLRPKLGSGPAGGDVIDAPAGTGVR